ncbi:MAG: hypothetical protein IIC00_12265 [Planctomycetes bacterium]|nr:hypothetical protein [Planctomycetota bacterium]
MWNKRINISIALIFVLSLFGSVVEGSSVEISPLNSPEDLDLSGNIIYAINFGNNGNPQFDGFVFSQDQDNPDLTFTTTAEGETSQWEGLAPNTGDSNLDMLLHGVTWQNSGGSVTTSISAGGLVVGMQYQLQLIFYTNHSRPMNIAVEGDIIIEQYDPFPAQGSVQGKGGSIVKHNFTAGDEILNINITPQRTDGSTASIISGLVLTEKPNPVPFTDYGSGTTIELTVGKGIWQLNWGQGPWTWSDSTDQPLLDPNVSGILDLRTTAPADVSAELIATLPIAGTLTLSAHDETYKDVIIGTMVLSGTGINVIDINASRVIVDEGSGMFLAPFHPPAPKLTLTLDEATGVFAYIDQIGDWELSLAGSYAVPLVKGLELQDNIFAALGGNVPLIGGIGAFALTGQYIPDMSKMVKSFCEYGTGVSLQLGAGGALWDQAWGKGAYEWYQCDADPDASILNESIVGMLETTTAGAPQIDENLILRFDFGGNFALTDYNKKREPEIIGQILGDVEGTFVADMNAVNAVVDEAAGTITIVFGAELHDAPDALITVTETTGTFESIHAVGLWEWYASGTITIALVGGLPLQDNIMAGLGDPDLLLGAEEEIVLSGSYYISSPED